jgi:zinc and cadmium transporter
VSDLGWIVVGGVGNAALSLIGGLTSFLPEGTLQRLLRPLVAFAAGSLLGSVFFHLIPAATSAESEGAAHAGHYVWVLAGFAAFLALEQFLHWHHCHNGAPHGHDEHQPMTYLILIGDALHNFLDGLSVASAFLLDPRAGIAAWLATAAHEIPQELGDYAILVYGGWPRSRALLFNLLSSSTFLVGGVLAYGLAQRIDLSSLILFGAGNFLYIGAADLVPEVKRDERLGMAALSFAGFIAGSALMFALGLLHDA